MLLTVSCAVGRPRPTATVQSSVGQEPCAPDSFVCCWATPPDSYRAIISRSGALCSGQLQLLLRIDDSRGNSYFLDRAQQDA